MKYFLLVSMTLFSSMSFSASIYCTGKIKNMFIESNGNVQIMGDWAPDRWAKVCNLNDEDVVTCSMWSSVISTATKDNLNVVVNYTNTEHTCSTLPTYQSAPKPNYVMIHNGG